MKKTIAIFLGLVMSFATVILAKAEEYSIKDYIKVEEIEVDAVEPESAEWWAVKPIEDYIRANVTLPKDFYITVKEFVDGDAKKVILQLYKSYVENNQGFTDYYDEVVVNIKYLEKDKDVYETALKILEEFREVYSFKFEDLVLINYYVHNPKEEFINEDLLKFSQTYKDIMSKYDKKFDVKLDGSSGMGVAYSLFIAGGTDTYIKYDDIFYAYNEPKDNNITSNGFTTRNVIYIPSDTEKTDEAYIEAAKKRISEAYPSVKVEIYAAGADSYTNPYDEEEYAAEFGSGYNGVHYVVWLDDAKHEFAIIPSDKIENVKVDAKDEETKVSVSTDSLEIPLDTVVSVKVVEEGSNEHKDIADTLKTEDFVAYDISLYSDLLEKNITKLENGKFEVKVPIIKELEGKKISAYYLDGEEVEEHPATIDENNNAVFETDHFSKYIIAEASLISDKPEDVVVDIVNPNTSDNIATYMLMFAVSLLTMSGMAYCLVKNQKKD